MYACMRYLIRQNVFCTISSNITRTNILSYTVLMHITFLLFEGNPYYSMSVKLDSISYQAYLLHHPVHAYIEAEWTVDPSKQLYDLNPGSVPAILTFIHDFIH